MNEALNELLESSDLPDAFQVIKTQLQTEARLRRKFWRDCEGPLYGKKVEFINGKIVEQLTAKRGHSISGERFFKLLATFVDLHGLGEAHYDQTMVSLTRNDYVPDITFFVPAKAALFRNDQVRFPPPDFVVEVLSPSTASIDRGAKFRDYARHGIAEYWIIDPDTESVEIYRLSEDAFQRCEPVDAETLTSSAIAGFEIPKAAIFDVEANIAALRRILAHSQAD